MFNLGVVTDVGSDVMTTLTMAGAWVLDLGDGRAFLASRSVPTADPDSDESFQAWAATADPAHLASVVGIWNALERPDNNIVPIPAVG